MISPQLEYILLLYARVYTRVLVSTILMSQDTTYIHYTYNAAKFPGVRSDMICKLNGRQGTELRSKLPKTTGCSDDSTPFFPRRFHGYINTHAHGKQLYCTELLAIIMLAIGF